MERFVFVPALGAHQERRAPDIPVTRAVVDLLMFSETQRRTQIYGCTCNVV